MQIWLGLDGDDLGDLGGVEAEVGARAGAELQDPTTQPAQQLSPVLADLRRLLAAHHRAQPREQRVTDLGGFGVHQRRLYPGWPGAPLAPRVVGIRKFSNGGPQREYLG
jgi:hypothetical protein